MQTVDPGPDGTTGTSDDGGAVTVYRRTARRRILANPDDAAATTAACSSSCGSRSRIAGRCKRRPRGPDARQRHQPGPGQQWTPRDRRRLQRPRIDNQRQRQAPLDFANSVKLLGTYALPWLGGLNLSGVYRFDSGNTWERTFFVGVPGVRPVRAEPRGTRRLPATTGLDLRADKTFPPGPREHGRPLCRRVQRHQSRRADRGQQRLGPGARDAIRVVRSAHGEDRCPLDVLRRRNRDPLFSPRERRDEAAGQQHQDDARPQHEPPFALEDVVAERDRHAHRRCRNGIRMPAVRIWLRLTPSLLRGLSGDELAFPDLPSARDLVLVGAPRKALSDAAGWGVTFGRESMLAVEPSPAGPNKCRAPPAGRVRGGLRSRPRRLRAHPQHLSAGRLGRAPGRAGRLRGLSGHPGLFAMTRIVAANGIEKYPRSTVSG